MLTSCNNRNLYISRLLVYNNHSSGLSPDLPSFGFFNGQESESLQQDLQQSPSFEHFPSLQHSLQQDELSMDVEAANTAKLFIGQKDLSTVKSPSAVRAETNPKARMKTKTQPYNANLFFIQLYSPFSKKVPFILTDPTF
ncbi:MAG: hypothetical protein D6735_00550 [Acidobacteria bacterium]|nr:MAG: hypothetical protein D6735_00550 [Acidobacteriota bacterium]